MQDLLASARVLKRQINRFLIEAPRIHAPALGRIGEASLEVYVFCEIGVVERVCLAKISAGVELVEPHLPRGSALFEKEHDCLHARTLKCAAGTIKHSVQVAAFQKQ